MSGVNNHTYLVIYAYRYWRLVIIARIMNRKRGQHHPYFDLFARGGEFHPVDIQRR